MHILLTGTCGSLGRATLPYLLEHGHRVTSIDLVPLPASLASLGSTSESSEPSGAPREDGSVQHHVLNLCDYTALDALFESLDPTPVDGLIHLGAIPDPLRHDARQVHGDNVLGAYNIMKTAIDHGVRRIVQASSVNATGFSYSPEGRQRFEVLPIDESAPMRAMDPYALSKHINEIQADSLHRTFGTRIASLRFHMVKPSYAEATPHSRWQDLFCWVSHRASARACLLGLTSEGWEGHEAFYIVAPNICWEGGGGGESVDGAEPGATGGKSPVIEGAEDLAGRVSTLELLDRVTSKGGVWEGRIDEIKRDWWAGPGKERRGVFDTSKAERMLGWYHG